jgi:hypothetical protein
VQVVPNSVYQWRCTPDAANFTLAAATHNPLLQSSECSSALWPLGAWVVWGADSDSACEALVHTRTTSQPGPHLRARAPRPIAVLAPSVGFHPPLVPPLSDAAPPRRAAAEWRQKYGDEVSMYKWCREGLPEEVPQLQPVRRICYPTPLAAGGRRRSWPHAALRRLAQLLHLGSCANHYGLHAAL